MDTDNHRQSVVSSVGDPSTIFSLTEYPAFPSCWTRRTSGKKGSRANRTTQLPIFFANTVAVESEEGSHEAADLAGKRPDWAG